MDHLKKFETREAPKERAILVTGGSGFVGRRLVAQLAEQDETVVCMYHHRLPEPTANVYPVCSDMSSSELIAAPLRGVETVVHLAWENNFVGPSEKLSWNINSSHLPKNVRLLRNLIDAMERAGTRRIIFMSALGASKKSHIPFLQEKYLAEFFVLNSKIPEKIIVRSSLICSASGTHDRFINAIAKVMQFPGLYPVPQAKRSISPVHIDDLCKKLVEVIRSPVKPEQAALVEVRGRDMLRIDEIFKLVSVKLGKGGKIALRGFLGETILPFFERDRRGAQIKLKHFLTLSSEVDEATLKENPLFQKMTHATQDAPSFKDALSAAS